MGSSSSKSVDEINASDIAAFVGSLGSSFEPYVESIQRSGISGSELASMKGDSLLIQLETVGVTNRLHKRKLAVVCRKEFSHYHGSRMDGSGHSGHSGHSGSSHGETSTGSVGTVDSAEDPSRNPPRGKLQHYPSFDGRPVCSIDDDAAVVSSRKGNGTSAAFENMCVAQSMESLTLLISMENQKQLLRQSDKPQGPPTQKAAIVLTDVQGSTNLWEADPRAMREALNLHDEIIRQHRAEHGGYEIDTEGDAFFMAFHSAKDALSFALGMQAAMRGAPWGDDILAIKEAEEDPVTHDRGLRVRVGIHMGPVTAQQNAVTGRLEYSGKTMERARQVEHMAAGGEVLATRSTWEASEVAAQIKDRGDGVVQVLGSQRKSRPVAASKGQQQSIKGAKTSVSKRSSRNRRSRDDTKTELTTRTTGSSKSSTSAAM